jgi:hypothetical protein
MKTNEIHINIIIFLYSIPLKLVDTLEQHACMLLLPVFYMNSLYKLSVIPALRLGKKNDHLPPLEVKHDFCRLSSPLSLRYFTPTKMVGKVK